MNFKDFPMNMMLIGLFFIAIVSFAIGMAHNYGKPADIIVGDYIDTTKIEQQLNATAEDAAEWSDALKSDNLFIIIETLVLKSIWGIGKGIITAVSVFLTLYFDLIQSVLGIPPLVTGTLTAVIVISLIFAAWKMMKQGE